MIPIGPKSPPQTRLLPDDAKVRKEMPMASGLLDYFPDALAAVANISFRGNQQHNPGQPLHWARGKSTDHADCATRHLIQRGTLDTDGSRHTAKLAWRALALLQEELELEMGLPLPRGCAEPTMLDAVKYALGSRASAPFGTTMDR
jgi:hypothetical protein